jgi:hypothetical protein
MLSSRRTRTAAAPFVSLRETLIAAGLEESLADELENLPHRVVSS